MRPSSLLQLMMLGESCPNRKGYMQVIDVWNELTERDYGYAQMPRFALGVSSGGAMALVLAKYFPLQVRGENFR